MKITVYATDKDITQTHMEGLLMLVKKYGLPDHQTTYDPENKQICFMDTWHINESKHSDYTWEVPARLDC